MAEKEALEKLGIKKMFSGQPFPSTVNSMNAYYGAGSILNAFNRGAEIDRRPTLVLPSGRDGGLLPGVDAAHGGGGQGELLETVTRSAPPTWTGTRRLLWTTLVEEKPPRKPELCRTLSCCPLHDYLVKCFSLMSQSSAVSAVVAIYRELAKKRKSTSQISIRLLFNFL